jgi:pimeloyl-ACP methyl ester carboxylesterase
MRRMYRPAMYINAMVTDPSTAEKPNPIVFVHGAWHASWCWTEHFTDYFAGLGYRSYAIDLRGHGASEGHVAKARISNYVHDLRRLTMELEAEPVIIGHSMGGLVVQQYLSQYRAAAGVLMAPVPTTGAIGATMRVIRDHPKAFLRANAALSLGPIVDEPDRAIALLFGPHMVDEDALRYAKCVQDESYPAYLEMILDLPRAARVHDPMLVLGAELDAVFSIAEIERTARAYETEAIIFEGMGHDMMLEPGWDGPAANVADWLEGTLNA